MTIWVRICNESGDATTTDVRECRDTSRMVRLDVLLAERGLVESRSRAQALVLAGRVRVDDQVVTKAGSNVGSDARLDVDLGPPFVSRGGEKLAAALAAFGVDPSGERCLDVGASTGGFTDCLLQAGAREVCAVDVGRGQLHERLRQDERVTIVDGVNARALDAVQLPFAATLAVIDVSFISLGARAAGRHALPGGRPGAACRSSSRSSRPVAGRRREGSCATPRSGARRSSASSRSSPSSEPLRWTRARRASPAPRATASSSCTS